MYLRVLLHLEKKVWNCVAVLTLRQKTKQYPNKQKTLRSVSLFFFFFLCKLMPSVSNLGQKMLI